MKRSGSSDPLGGPLSKTKVLGCAARELRGRKQMSHDLIHTWSYRGISGPRTWNGITSSSGWDGQPWSETTEFSVTQQTLNSGEPVCHRVSSESNSDPKP